MTQPAVNLDSFEVDTETPEINTKETFVVDDLGKATWAMRQLRGIVAQIEGNVDIANAEKERIDAWVESVNKPLLNDRAYFEALLTQYLREERKNDPDKKTISTPYGKIISRATQPKWEVLDELTNWLLNNNDQLVRVKYEVDKTELKKAYEINGNQAIDPKTGEVIPFVTIIPSDINYKVEVEL